MNPFGCLAGPPVCLQNMNVFPTTTTNVFCINSYCDPFLQLLCSNLKEVCIIQLVKLIAGIIELCKCNFKGTMSDNGLKKKFDT